MLLKKELDKAKMKISFNQKFGKATGDLNEILEAQWASSNWAGLGYEVESSVVGEFKGKNVLTFGLAK